MAGSWLSVQEGVLGSASTVRASVAGQEAKINTIASSRDEASSPRTVIACLYVDAFGF
jgi:hypothetical protein